MSFGFGVGDFLAVSKLAMQIQRRLQDSTGQFKAIQTETQSFITTLNLITSTDGSGHWIPEQQPKEIMITMEACKGLFEELDALLTKYEMLGNESEGVRAKLARTVKKLQWDQGDADQLRSRITSTMTMLDVFITNLTRQAIKVADQKIGTLTEGVQRLQSNRDRQETREILDWISPLNFSVEQDAFSSRRQDGTGNWLVEAEEFKEWMNTKGKTLICEGMPGAGKTMLVSMVVEHLEETIDQDTAAVLYIYGDYRARVEQTYNNLLSSLLKQILQCQNAIPSEVMDSYSRHQSKGTRPSVQELHSMVKTVATHFSQMFIIVDALDELDSHIRKDLVTAIDALQGTSLVNVMMTSRHIHSATLRNKNSLYLEVRATQGDIRRYVHGRLTDLELCVESDELLQEEITSAITDAVDGMFLLAQLFTESLRGLYSPFEIEEALKQLPTGYSDSEKLNSAYDKVITQISTRGLGAENLAKRILGWIVYAERLMSVSELRHALAIQIGTSEFNERCLINVEDILVVCTGLVIIDSQRDNIRLVHYTTQEYFRRNGKQFLPNAEEVIAKSCLTYLLYDEFASGWIENMEWRRPGSAWDWSFSRQKELVRSSPRQRELGNENANATVGNAYYISWPDSKLAVAMRKLPLLNYAVRHWALHASNFAQGSVRELAFEFCRDSAKISNASQILFMLDEESALFEAMGVAQSNSPMCALHLVAYLGSHTMLSALLCNESAWADVKDSNNGTPLWWAAYNGCEAAVEELLLQKDVDINNKEHYYDSTPLLTAVTRGHRNIVKLLLKNDKINVNSVTGSSQVNTDYRGNSSLHQAAKHGHHAIVEMLLTSTSILPDLLNYEGLTPLMTSIRGKYYYPYGEQLIVVEQLLKREDVHTNSQDNKGRTALFWAVNRHVEWAVQSLFTRADLDVNIQARDGSTALMAAARRGYSKLMKPLLSHPDISINSKNSKGATALIEAAKHSYENIVEILVSLPNIGLNDVDDMGYTAVHWAASQGRNSILMLLLAQDNIDVSIKDAKGKMPVAHAATNAMESTVELLLPRTSISESERENFVALASQRRGDFAEKSRIMNRKKREEGRVHAAFLASA